MVAIVSVFPVGKGASLSKAVSEALEIVDKSGVDYRLTSMGTILEGDWDEVMRLVKKLRDRVLKSSDRVYVTLAIDDRKGKSGRIDAKVRSVEKRLGKTLRK